MLYHGTLLPSNQRYLRLAHTLLMSKPITVSTFWLDSDNATTWLQLRTERRACSLCETLSTLSMSGAWKALRCFAWEGRIQGRRASSAPGALPNKYLCFVSTWKNKCRICRQGRLKNPCRWFQSVPSRVSTGAIPDGVCLRQRVKSQALKMERTPKKETPGMSSARGYLLSGCMEGQHQLVKLKSGHRHTQSEGTRQKS